MEDSLFALSFIGRLGVGNLRNEILVDTIKASLQGMGTDLDEKRINIQEESRQNQVSPVKEEGRVQQSSRDTGNKPVSTSGHSSASEIGILRHLLEEESIPETQNGATVPGNRHVRTIELSLALREMLVQARNGTAWCSPLNNVKQDGEWDMEWKGMPRLIAILVLVTAMEKLAAAKGAAFVAAMVNHFKRMFRYSFQSSESDLCVIDHPEWAINHIRDIVLAYQGVFKRIKREATSNTDEIYAALALPEEACTIEERDRYREYFKRLCVEFAHGGFFRSWCTSMMKEARWFVYSRLPLLIYDYRTVVPDVRLSMNQVANLASEVDLLTRVSVMQSTFEDDEKVNLFYNLMRAMTGLAATVKQTSHEAAFELFGDFDRNVPIPVLKLEFEDENLNSRLQLDHQNEAVYGALDALVSLESKVAKKVTDRLLFDEAITGNILCDNPLRNNWYLQDGSYTTKPMTTLFSLLKLFEQRCECLETSKARSEFTVKAIVPMVNSYLEYIKVKWNMEEDMFRSCVLTSFLIEATTGLYEYLVKYPCTVYMPQILASVEKVMHKMMHIVKDFMWDTMEEPFAAIHEKRLDVITYLKEKLLQMAVLSSPKSYKQIMNAVLDNSQRLLLESLVPSDVGHIILKHPEHVEMALQNCNLLCNELEHLVDSRESHEEMRVIQDVKTLLDANTDDLINAVETINGSLQLQSIFNDFSAMLKSHEPAKIVERTASTKKKRISIQTESFDPSFHRTSTTDILQMHDSDSDESMVDNTEDHISAKTETVGEQLIIDKIKQKLKVQRLNAHQLYTLSLHILHATLEQRKFEELGR